MLTPSEAGRRGRLFEDRLRGGELPAHEVVVDLVEGDASHLRVLALHLRAGALDELFGPSRSDVDEPELGFDIGWKILRHLGLALREVRVQRS